MKTVHRLMLEKILLPKLKKIKGKIAINIGAGILTYKSFVNCDNCYCIDIDKKNNPDMCMDAYALGFKSNCADLIVMTEVLEHLKEPEKVVSEIYRVLKKGGVCIASTPFMYPFHGDEKMNDYYRFTEDSLKYLFSSFHSVEIIPIGSTLQTVWALVSHNKRMLKPINYLVQYLKWGNINSGFVIVAKK